MNEKQTRSRKRLWSRTRTWFSVVGTPHLLHHLVLFVEELHFHVSADGERLRELEQHQLVLPPGVNGVRGVDLNLQLVHHELRICKENRTTGSHV